jgi:hypothetical protein
MAGVVVVHEQGPTWQWGRPMCGFLAAVGACASFLVAPSFASAGVPEIEQQHMGEIVQWVYKNGGEEDPESCGEICGWLWNAEQGAAEHGVLAEKLWNEFGELVYRTEMWGRLPAASGGRLRRCARNRQRFLGRCPVQNPHQING